jgi:hypothetical protein
MTGKDGLENQKNINKELSATDRALLEAAKKTAQLTEESRTLTEELKDQLNIRSKTNEGEKTLLSLSRDITKSAQENKVALRETGDISKQLIKDQKNLDATKREQLILEQTIGKENIDQAKAIASRAKAIQTNNAKILQMENEIANQKGGATKEQLKLLENQKVSLRLNEASLKASLTGATAEAQRLALVNGLVTAAEENVVNSEEQKAAQDRINKSLGIAGKLAGAFKQSFGGIASAIGIDKVADDMKKFATEAEDAGKSVSRLQVLGVGMVSAFKGLGNTLTDPSFLLTNLITGFNKVDKAATDFQQQTGQDLNTMTTSLNQFNGGLITSAEYIKAASDLTKEFGLNAAAVFTPENLSEAASMTKEMGLAGKEAANLARLSKINGGNIKDQNKSIIAGVNSANAQNKTAVAHGQILRDIANTSEGIAISYAGYPDKLAKAATTAKGLGMTLDQLDKISSSLLDFQSSIEAEMQAELLTGRALNLEKARELALSNDLAGVAEELANQGITSANFSQMNRIQQEAQAKALGMSRDEMARMLLQQEIGKDLSGEGLNAAQKATLEDLKRVDAQEKFATAVAKLQQALAPVVGFFAKILSNSYLIYSVMGVALFAKMPMLVNSAKGLAGGFANAWKNAKGLATGITNMIKGKGTEKLKETLIPKDTDKVGKLGKDAKPGDGKGLKENLQGLASGLRSMGTGPVAKGALNLGLFGVAAIPTLASIPFLLFMGLTPLTMLKINMQSLASGLRSMGTGTVLKGIGGFSLLALASTLMIPGSVGLLMFGGASYVAAAGMGVLTPALIAFGTAMSTGVGALGLGALVGAAVGLGVAFSLVGVGALAMGKGISLAAQGFGIMVPHMLSLIPAIPALFLLSSALVSIGTGLSLIATAGTLAIPALLALGTVSGALGSIFGSEEGAGNEEKLSMAGVEAKLDKLIAIVESGGDVYIDGTKVGKTLSLVTSKMG